MPTSSPALEEPEDRSLRWVLESGQVNLGGSGLLDDYAICPICSARNLFIYLESYASPARCVESCAHIRCRQRVNGLNWYGFSEEPREG